MLACYLGSTEFVVPASRFLGKAHVGLILSFSWGALHLRTLLHGLTGFSGVFGKLINCHFGVPCVFEGLMTDEILETADEVYGEKLQKGCFLPVLVIVAIIVMPMWKMRSSWMFRD